MGASKSKAAKAAKTAATPAKAGGGGAGATSGAKPAAVGRKSTADPVTANPFEATYAVGKFLGKGNYAAVHLVTRRKDGAEFAAKIMDKAKLNKEDADAVAVEVGVLKALNHPDIIHFESFFDMPRQFVIVSELMMGGELFARIVQRTFYAEHDAQGVVRLLSDALGYMHKLGFVHRDLKPENILLKDATPDSVVKLADFGFARPVGEGCRTACGTPGYVAPEIIGGQKYGASCDVWSLGVISACAPPAFAAARRRD